MNSFFNTLFYLISFLLLTVRANIQFEPSCGSTNGTSASFCTSKYIVVGATTPTDYRQLARSANNFKNFFGSLYDQDQKNIFALNDELQIVTRQRQQVIDFSNEPNFGGIVLGDGSQTQVYYVWGFGAPYPSSLQAFTCVQNNKQDEFGDYTFRIVQLVQLTVGADVKGIWDITGGTTYNNQLVLMTEGQPPNTQVLGEYDCLIDPKNEDCLYNDDPQEVTDLAQFFRFNGQYPETYNDTLKEFSLQKPPFTSFNPYWYGYPIGVSFGVGNDGPTVVGTRYYNMGRLNAVGALIMSDGVTVYLPSATGGLFKFVMNSAGDPSVGRLYVAQLSRFTQTQAASSLSASTPDYQLNVKWLPLTEDPISNADANRTITAGDMPKTIQDLTGAKSPDDGGNCGGGRAQSVTINGTQSCFVQPETGDPNGLRTILAETQIYAKLLGGTVDSLYYGAMTNTTNSTFISVNYIKSEGDLTLSENKCGCIFQGDFDDNFNIYRIRPYICGQPSNTNNKCSPDYPANPRSAASIPKYNRVFIGEESDNHDNNFLWFVNPETRNASRIMSAPLAGGFTYLGYQTDIYGVNYLTVSIAHPFQGLNVSNINLGNTSGTFGWTGYFTINEANEQLSYEPIAVPYTSGDTSLVGKTRAVTYGNGYNLSSFALLEGGKTYGNGDSKVTMALYGKNGQVIRDGGNPIIGTNIKASFVPCGDKVASVVTMNGLPSTQFEVDLGEGSSTRNLGVLNEGNVTRVLTEWNTDELGGLWNTKTGRISSYLSIINGEIWEPDASFFERGGCGQGSRCLQTDITDFARYFGEGTITGRAQSFNPYQYGYALETNVSKTEGSCSVNSVRKLYTLGRFSHGDFVFMPDNKTVYMADYNATGAFFRFVSDNPNDYDTGSLSAAKFKNSDDSYNRYEISWIELGKGNQADLAAAIGRKPSFSDIFEVERPDRDGNCPDGFEVVPLDEDNPECLQSKDDTLAAFLESRRFAQMKGATVQLSFMSSLTLNSAKQTIVASFESVQGRMAQKVNTNDDDAPKPKYPLDVQFNRINCGLIAFITYDEGTQEINGMSAALIGTNDPSDGADTENTCSTATMARPTYLYTAADQMILIGEQSNTPEDAQNNPGAKSFLTDTYKHQYPAFWQLDMDNFRLSRQNGQTMFAYGFQGGTISEFKYTQFEGKRHLTMSLGAPADGSSNPILLYMGHYDWAVDKSQEQQSITADGGQFAPEDTKTQTELSDEQSVYRGPSGSSAGGGAPSSAFNIKVSYKIYIVLALLAIALVF